MDLLLSNMPVFWLVAAIIFGVIEALTMGLLTIWFAGGALIALLSSLLHVPIGLQVIIFIVASIALLVLTRRIFVDKLKTGKVKTNVDALIGKTAIVTSDLRPLEVGRVTVSGQEWSAVLEDEDKTCISGTKVTIQSIEGVKLIVKPIKE